MTFTRRQTLIAAAATVAAAALPAVAIAREQITAVVHFGRWRDGRAVTADEAGWSNGTIIAMAPDEDRLELGRLTEAQLRPDGGYNVWFNVLQPGEVPTGTAILCESRAGRVRGSVDRAAEPARSPNGEDGWLTITRRQTLIGAAATAAAAAPPAVAKAAPAKDWAWTGITWDGRHPSSQCAVWWEDRMHALLWKRVGDQWACLGPIVDPVYTMIADGGAPGMETYVQVVPAWDLVALENLAEDETDTLED
jgi:hypothetical protein